MDDSVSNENLDEEITLPNSDQVMSGNVLGKFEATSIISSF